MATDHRGRRRSGEGTWTWLPRKSLWRLQVTTEAGARVAFYGATRAECERKRQLGAQGVLRAKDTVGEWLTEWSDQVCRAVKPSTCRRYRGAVQTHLIPTLGHIRLDRLTADHISEAIAVIARKRFKGGDPISPTTVRRTYDVLNNALERAVKQRRLVANPARALTPPRQEHREFATLTEDETNRLLDAAIGDRLEALFTLAVRCGLREGELLGLQWRNIHLDGQRPSLDITGSLQRDHDGTLRKGEPKTRSARRTINLDADSAAALRKLSPGRADGFLFTYGGRPMSPQALTRQHFLPLLRKAGLPRMRLHDLRHTCATHLIEDGVSVYAVSHLLGHASVAVTQGIYGHLTSKQTEAVTQAMNARSARRQATS
jgi:integrase